MGPVLEIKKRTKSTKSKKKVKPLPNGCFASAPSLLQPLDWWDDFSKRLAGTLLSESKELANFESIFKISRKTFNYICSLVKDDLMTKSAYFVDIHGNHLSLNDCVAVALRRLSSGDSLSIVGESLGINQSTVAQITWRFVEAIEERGLHHIHWPETDSSESEDIKSKFEKLGLPNCCGVIDTTRVLMSFSLDESNSIWCDRDKKHSMILLAIVGPDMRFLDVVAGLPGSLCESVALKNSSFFTLAEESKRLNGKRNELQEYIVGHAGFPRLPWLLTPYNGKKLSDSQMISLNKQISASQVIAKSAFFRLKETWRIIRGTMWRPDKNRLPRIILGCCILHNILIDLEDEVQIMKKSPVADHKESHVYQLDPSNSDSGLREMVCLPLSRKQLDSPQ